jgi:hypothetical protein
MNIWCELSLKKSKTKIIFLDFYMDLVRRKTEHAPFYIIILCVKPTNWNWNLLGKHELVLELKRKTWIGIWIEMKNCNWFRKRRIGIDLKNTNWNWFEKQELELEFLGKNMEIYVSQFFTIIIYGIHWKYWFHSKKFEFFLLSFLPIKGHKTWKKQ